MKSRRHGHCCRAFPHVVLEAPENGDVRGSRSTEVWPAAASRTRIYDWCLSPGLIRRSHFSVVSEHELQRVRSLVWRVQVYLSWITCHWDDEKNVSKISASRTSIEWQHRLLFVVGSRLERQRLQPVAAFQLHDVAPDGPLVGRSEGRKDTTAIVLSEIILKIQSNGSTYKHQAGRVVPCHVHKRLQNSATHLNAYDHLIVDKAVKRKINVGEFMWSPVSMCPHSNVLAILPHARDVAVDISEQSWTRDVDASEHTYVRVVNLFDENGHGDSLGFFVLWIRSLMLRRRTEMVTEIFICSFLLLMHTSVP